MTTLVPPAGTRLVDRFERGLDAPICLTWELTYACNLACVHCLSSSGRRDPRELTTAECRALIDEFERMQIFYVNIGGGEPTIRSDFWELVDYATEHHVGVKFSTNGSRITEDVATRLAASDYVDVQISLDGATAEVNDAVRGDGSFATAVTAMERLAAAGFAGFKLSVVVTRHNVGQLDAFKAIADRYGAQLRLTRLRPSGRGADVWDDLHPTADQQRQLYDWLVRRGEEVLTGDSFFHLAAYGDALPGLNLCGAGRVVCLVDPVGDVYACPFAIHDEFLAGNVRDAGGFTAVWRESDLFLELREPQSAGACSSCGHFDACRGGCMAAKFFTGLPLDGPDPECVLGHGVHTLDARGEVTTPRPSPDHSSRPRKVAVALTTRVITPDRRPDRSCDEHPLAGFAPRLLLDPRLRPDLQVSALVEPVGLGPRTAPSRVVFGPHETNLGDGRSLGPRHVAYYATRAAGGAGVIVTETASVHPSDWPYERAPLAAVCGPGWRSIAESCRPHGTVLLAGLGHAGGQGSSAYSQSVLWAPSAVADVVSRELPMAMGRPEITALIEGFASSARIAVDAGLDGVELDAGPLSVLRQFHSGLTNQRDDDFGQDRLLVTREVVAAVRRAVGPDHLVGLRLSCDELAPWAGVTPEHTAEQVAALADSLDLLTVVRGGPYSSTAYRPDAHSPDGFNLGLCAAMRRAAEGRVPVVLQGSVVDPTMAHSALADGTADLVEMTRAQIADPDLVAKVRADATSTVRPCILCNQACRVHDNRNPLVSCVGEPRSGHETVDVDPGAPGPEGPDPDVDALVVGAGPAGLECARVLALRGHRVRVVERSDHLGGALVTAAVGPGRRRLSALPRWLGSECERLGVRVTTGTEVTAADLDAARDTGTAVVLATGGRPAPPPVPGDGTVLVVDALTALGGGTDALPDGPVLVHDPVGGPIGVGVAEWLAEAGRDVALVTADQIAGTLLSLTGDLADANTRLQRAGVRRELRALLRRLADGRAHLEDPWTGATRTVLAAVVVDCGHRLPDESLYLARPGTARAGDCVAPRSVLEAVLEGRRLALALCASAPTSRIPTPTGATR